MSEGVINTVEPVLKGIFSLYATADGGYHLAYRPEDAEDDQHMDIPGMYVKLAQQAMSGKGMLRRFLGR